jgi:4-hydroxy-2-oxoheptanedioate aldolase
MNGLQVSKALRSGQRIYGTLIVSTSPHWPAFVKSTGVDLVFIDTEHIAIERTLLAWMCQTYRALDIAPIVRIPEPDPYRACMALDGGASGIIAPYVETPEQVRKLYGAVKLRPVKGAVLEAKIGGSAALPGETGAYVDERNAGNVLIINIESTPAMANLDSILEVPGVDAVLVGPHDLSCSLGVPEQYTHPLFLEKIRYIIATARKHGVGVGIHFWNDWQQEVEWGKLGANLIMHSGDITLFSQKLREDLRRFREAFGDEASAAGGSREAVV